jgi:oligopeptide/dipeptide ABC transporter ATP-binding protein
MDPVAQDPLLVVHGLRVAAPEGEIVRGVDLAVGRREIVGIFGESGCGKTTLGLSVVGLLGPGLRVTQGEIRIEGQVIVSPSVDETSALRGARIGFIPQDPFSSFDPLRRIGPQVGRVLRLHRDSSRRAAETKVLEILSALGIADPRGLASSFPHELSGGMLQRAVIAATLIAEPELLIADEPTTALDVVLQRQVLVEFLRLVREIGTALLIITHDLGVLAETADRLAAIYAGGIVEFGPVTSVLGSPRHPYVGALRESMERPAHGHRLSVIEGQPPVLPGNLDPCAFAPRCPRAQPPCYAEEPTYAWPASDGVACHYPLDSLPENRATRVDQ